jgi:hypothetical protein
MAIGLQELVPIDDVFVRGCSLIEEVFGRNFYVEDERGRALTTLRNQRLLRYAQEIVGTTDRGTADLHREDLSRLGQLADVVTSADYRRPRPRDAAATWRHWEFDNAQSAGSLE